MSLLDYTWGTTRGSLSLTLDDSASSDVNRACANQYPPLTVEVLKALDACLDVAPTPDFIFYVSPLDGGLALTHLEHCSQQEGYLCDQASAYFVCASKVAAVVQRSAASCWRRFTFVTFASM